MGSLHSRVSPSILPLHYGGQADIPFDKGEEFLSYLVNFESEYIGNIFIFGYIALI